MPSPFGSQTIGLRKKSPYNKFFRKSVLRMKSIGELDLFIKRNSLPPIECDAIKTSVDFLGWSKMAPLFFVFFLGVFFSFPIAIYEFFHRPQKINSISEKTKNLEQTATSLLPMLQGIMKASENDESYFRISNQYLADTEIFLEQLNQIRTNSKQDINTLADRQLSGSKSGKSASIHVQR